MYVLPNKRKREKATRFPISLISEILPKTSSHTVLPIFFYKFQHSMTRRKPGLTAVRSRRCKRHFYEIQKPQTFILLTSLSGMHVCLSRDSFPARIDNIFLYHGNFTNTFRCFSLEDPIRCLKILTNNWVYYISAVNKITEIEFKDYSHIIA